MKRQHHGLREVPARLLTRSQNPPEATGIDEARFHFPVLEQVGPHCDCAAHTVYILDLTTVAIPSCFSSCCQSSQCEIEGKHIGPSTARLPGEDTKEYTLRTLILAELSGTNFRQPAISQRKRFLVVKASCAALQTILDNLRPDKLDHTSIVIAIRKIMVESRETVPLAGLFHLGQML